MQPIKATDLIDPLYYKPQVKLELRSMTQTRNERVRKLWNETYREGWVDYQLQKLIHTLPPLHPKSTGKNGNE